ncbi:hypothetical protein [Streptomyces katsurahamanus]|uniref:hypothetical protein n=1 Tax=Streptomyces katsurahamanus TaxID=2577098 RepID=UPI0018865F35|nr:hypothetical protein [Streptomyces katsurahamanus]
MLVLRGGLAPEVRDRAGEAAVRLLATDQAAGRDRSVDGKDGSCGVVALDDAFDSPATAHAVFDITAEAQALMTGLWPGWWVGPAHAGVPARTAAAHAPYELRTGP